MIDRLIYGAAAAALVLAACEQQPATSPAPEDGTMSETGTETAMPVEAPAADATIEPAAEGGALAALENNPFAEEWTENFGAPPLDRITEAHFMPAFEAGMADHSAHIDAIANNREAPTF